jgi:hypothetical protein
MSDFKKSRRRRSARQPDAEPKSREALEAEHGQGNVWDTQELARDFIILGLGAPLVFVRRKSDGQKGSLSFQHLPRLYFGWRAVEQGSA